ncbi:hypothetical protein GCM10029964_027230 [Kibdelosporangium lantanae]
MSRITHWINGKPWDGPAERTGEVYDPATGQVSGVVDFASQSEVDAAVAAAATAFPAWRDASLAKRSNVLFKFRELLAARKDDLAAIVTAEHGKVLDDAGGEVQRALEAVEFACGIPHLLKGGFSENVSTRVDVYSIQQPLGVVGVISPFNFPAMVPLWFVPNAIACGNTVVLKPSEKDPSAAVFIAELWAEAGLPDGVLNVLHGDKVAVDGLLEHPTVKAVSFVGSTPIARYVYETGTRHGKRVQALGGAKNHMVVLPDADLDLAADAAVSAGFGSAGSGAWPSRCWWPWIPSGTRSSARSPTGCPVCMWVTAGGPGVRWVRWSPAPTATVLSPTWTLGCRRVRRSRSTVVATRSTAPPTGSGSGRRCSTTSPRTCRSTPTRSSARCCRSCAYPPTTPPWNW